MRTGTVPLVTGVVAVGIAVAMTASGCTKQPPPLAPDPTPTVRPVFASDAEALAAAEKAYAAYLRVNDQVARDGGRNVQLLKPIETPRQFAYDSKSFGNFLSSHSHVSGHSKYHKFALQQADSTADGGEVVKVYVCLDVSGTRVLNSRNQDVTPVGDEKLPLKVTFRSTSEAPSRLLLDGSDVWSGTDFC